MSENRGLDDVFGSLDEDDKKRSRLNAEWTTLVALREVLGMALKGARNGGATYKQAFALGEMLIPQLFDPDNSLLNKEKLSATARKYIQMADASSQIEQKPVSPVELIKGDITRYEKLLANETVLLDMDLVRKEFFNMQAALRELQKRRATENSLIFRDTYQVTYHVEERELPVSEMGRNYRQFGISAERALRVRVLHPDKPEYATGADLIYENYWDTGSAKLVRFAVMQYKVWRNKTLYIDERMQKQLEKMEKTFCDKSFCEAGNGNRRKDAFRLPYCSAFLRPTDELQSEDASLISTGCYAPICVVKRQQQPTPRGNYVLYSKDIRSEAITHRVFEEVFNINMLGSRWLTYDELEKLYHDTNILEPDEHIIIHAQEF